MAKLKITKEVTISSGKDLCRFCKQELTADNRASSNPITAKVTVVEKYWAMVGGMPVLMTEEEFKQYSTTMVGVT